MRKTIGASALRVGVGTRMSKMEMTSLDDLEAFEQKLRYQVKMIQNAYDGQIKNLEPIYINAAVKFVREQIKALSLHFTKEMRDIVTFFIRYREITDSQAFENIELKKKLRYVESCYASKTPVNEAEFVFTD